MARASKFTIDLDTLESEAVAGRLEKIDARQFGVTAMATVNQVAGTTREDAKRAILSGVNLTEAYVDERLTVNEATDPAKPVATIVSPMRATTLASYGAAQLSTGVRWTNTWIQANKKPSEIGEWPKWVLRRGRPSSGIAVNFKAAGVQVEVLKGQHKSIGYAFVVQKGGKQVVLKRTKDDRLVGAQGPAVFQMFRHALDPQFLKKVGDSLERSLTENLANKLLKGLT